MIANTEPLLGDYRSLGVIAFSRDAVGRMVVEDFPERIVADPSFVDYVGGDIAQMPDPETLIITVANGNARYKSVGDTLLFSSLGANGRPRFVMVFALQDFQYLEVEEPDQPTTTDLNSVEGIQQAISVLQARLQQVAPVQVTEAEMFLEPAVGTAIRTTTVAPIGRRRPAPRSITRTGLG